MPIGVYFNEVMEAATYDQILKQLEDAGAGTPAGRTYHACFGDPGDKISVFDVWESQETFDAFGETLLPILAAAGVEGVEPDIVPIRNTIVG